MLLVLAACLPTLIAACAPDDASRLPESGAEILWDEWGIPHVRAADHQSLFRAYGRTQARNHGELLLRTVGRARGRAAEYWGGDYLESDRVHRLARIPQGARRAYEEADPEIRRWVDAFARGVNGYLEDDPEAASAAARRALPVTGEDVLAVGAAVSLRFSAVWQMIPRWLERQASDVAAHRGEGETGGVGLTVAGEGGRAGAYRPGSNAWAVAGGSTASGHALLLANPHLPWSGVLSWMEAHLTAPGLNVYGASIVGMPVINIGFTRAVGWTHTVNTQDFEDFYELRLTEARPDGRRGYRFGGEVREFERDTTLLRIRSGGEGEPRTDTLELLRSVHGPVVARRGDRALAMRQVHGLPGHGPAAAYRQWWEMARSSGPGEFRSALERQAIVGQNVVYADSAGNAAYFYGAASPVRPRGDRSFWRGTVPGGEPELVWTEIHPLRELPQVVEPPSGWVQNANDPPWFSTLPPSLDPEGYPSYLAPRGLEFRPQRSLELLSEGVDGDGIDHATFRRLKHSTRMALADRVLPELVRAAREHGPPDARRAAGVLEEWDRTADADSRGGVLFQAWAMSVLESPEPVFATGWSAEEPISTPDSLARPAEAARELARAAHRVEEAYGRMDVAWGEVHRLRRDTVDLPANGAPGGLGVFRVVGYEGTEDGPRVAAFGDSFVATVEFADPPRAFALIGYGNASRSGSVHRTDQLPLFADQELRRVHFHPDSVEAHATARDTVEAAAGEPLSGEAGGG